MTKPAAITITAGALFPGRGIERVYRLRAGSKGTGKIIHEHRARGSWAAYDEARWACEESAERFGYEIVAYIDSFDPLNG